MTRRDASDSRDDARAAEHASALLEGAASEPEAAARALAELAERDPRLALATVAVLSRVHTPAAARLLVAIDASDLPRELRKEARRGLHRLKALGIEAERPSAPRAPAQAPRQRARLYEAWATAPDWRGSRLVWLLADRPLGGIWAVGLVLNDVRGMVQASFRDTTRKRFQEDLARWREENELARWLRLPVDYATQLVGEALALNERGGTAIPQEFQVNRELVEDIARPFERALVYQEISPGAAKLSPEWLEESPRLLHEPELQGWQFDPEAVRPFVRPWLEARGGLMVLNPQASREREAAILSQAIQKVVAPEVRRGLQRRLEEMAYVFLRTDRPRQARLAVGAAVGLEEASASRLLLQQSAMRLDQHPFVRAMMEASLEAHE